MSDMAQAHRNRIRHAIVRRLRYSGKRGTRRAAEIIESRDWPHAVMALVGTEHGGNYDPPAAKTVRYPWQGLEDRVFAANNDGFELWFGYPDRWTWHLDNDEVRRLTKYLIIEWWVKARWLGLRRPIYYAALRSAVKPYRGGDR